VKLIKFDMWQGSHKIALREVLEVLPENSLDWRMLWLYASGAEWLGRASIGELEDDIREGPMGIPLTWSKLKSFASGLTDLHDVILAVALPNSVLKASEIRAEDYRSAHIVIEGVDGGLWIMGSSDERILGGLPKSWNIRDVRS
jgi:hypothetical protein